MDATSTSRARRPLTALAGAAVILAAGAAGLALTRGEAPQPAAARGATEDFALQRAQAALAENPGDWRAQVIVADAALVQARTTGDPAWYARAEAAARASLAARPGNPEALDALASLALSRHRFTEALALSGRSLAAAPGRVAPLGIRGDALIELGRYAEGFAAIDRRLLARPDLASYSRASYAAELRGQIPAAVGLMELAVDAGRPGGEPRAWARVQLGLLHFGTGDLAAAERQMRVALAERPDDPRATAGLARVLAARGRLGRAERLYDRALARQPLAEYAAAIGELGVVRGDRAAVRDSVALVVAMQRLQRAAGARVDLDLAQALADLRVPGPADVRRARAARAERPGVIGDQVLGWVLTRAGRCEEGLGFARRSLRLGTRDATAHFRAGMAAACAGAPAEARRHLAGALAMNPHFSVRWAPVARRELGRLGA